jgi:TPR repeat protein
VLGVMAEQGLDRPPDAAQAARFYDSAVRGGHASAAVNLGVMYDEGRGVPRDGIRAQWLYSFAAKSGDVTGKNNLAYLWGRQNGLLEEALCLSAETLKAEPDNGAYLDTYGFVLLRLGRLDDAERFFAKVLRSHRDPVAAEHRGDVARLRGDSAGARRWWQAALGMNPNDHDRGRIRAKLAGQADDLDAHPPFQLRNDGFGKDCAMPAV